MFKVKVLTQGKIKEPWLTSALEEYKKRMSRAVIIEWVLVDTPQELTKLALKEPMLIALDIPGKLMSSEEWAQALFSTWGARPSFVIGGAEGLDPSVVQHAKARISLSPLTFTHQMVRLILVEQLYRAVQIHQGTQYHK